MASSRDHPFNFNRANATRLLSHEDLRDLGIRYSRVQIWRKVKDGTFPAPIKLGEARNAWIEAEVVAWIEQRIAERDGEAA